MDNVFANFSVVLGGIKVIRYGYIRASSVYVVDLVLSFRLETKASNLWYDHIISFDDNLLLLIISIYYFEI